MSKVNLKDNIWIEGFDKLSEMQIRLLTLPDSQFKAVIYDNKTSEIPEELAKECVNYLQGNHSVLCGYYESGYEDFSQNEFRYKTAKESIQSACPEEFCIIYKTN